MMACSSTGSILRRTFLLLFWISPADSFLPVHQLSSGVSPRVLALSATRPSSSNSGTKRGGSGGSAKGKKDGKNKKKGGGSKTYEKTRAPDYSPRPVLADYEHNTDPWTNEQRLFADAIRCDHFGECPGCVRDDHVGDVDIIQSAKSYFSSTAIRKNRLDLMRGSGSVFDVLDEDDDFYKVVVPSKITEWRTQAKLAVAPKTSSWTNNGCIFGLYKRRSHDVVTIPDCRVHHPSINRAIEILTKVTLKVGTPGFNRDSHEGGLRYVQCQVARTTGKVCLTLVWAASDVKRAQPALSRLHKALLKEDPDLWHSVWCHCNDGVGNNIFSRNSKSWHRLSGPEFVREPFPVGDKGWIYFSPLAFRQGNMDGFDVLANEVARAIPGGSKVCELYAGVGLLGLTSLLHHAQPGGMPLDWVRCSDENPANLRCFRRTIDSIPPEISKHQPSERPSQYHNEFPDGMTIADLIAKAEAGEEVSDMFSDGESDRVGPRATYLVASAADALRAGQALGANVLVVDPPRKGLEEDVLAELCKPFNSDQPESESVEEVLTEIDEHRINWANDVQTLIYVSCGFEALARDCQKLLLGQGGWKLESATGYVLFPGSDHVETLCIFQRK